MSAKSVQKVKRQRSISQVHFGFTQSKTMSHFILGSERDDDTIDKFEHQVAGHEFSEEKETVGLLKCQDGTILKPVMKAELGLREANFYAQLEDSSDPNLKELKDFVPKYYGKTNVNIKGKNIEFLKLENLCSDMLEPCVMDIKLGQRTWDPLAPSDKIKREMDKYAQCKKDVAFCIPGFQLYTLSSGELRKFDKNYGKTLDGKIILGAIKTFLNDDGKGSICRSLILQILTTLWRLQKWARNQTSLRFYSSSLLVIYDTKGLRDCCGNGGNFLMQSFERRCSVEIHPVNRKISLGTMKYSTGGTQQSFSGQLSSKGPIFAPITSTPTTPMLTPNQNTTNIKKNSQNMKSWHVALNKLQRSHSFHNNFDDNISKMKLNYNSVLDDLVTNQTKKYRPWAVVKLIDFSHTFPAEERLPDFNFSQGLNNVVKIFEHILSDIEGHPDNKT